MVFKFIIFNVIIENSKKFNTISNTVFNNIFVGNSDFIIKNVSKNGIKKSITNEIVLKNRTMNPPNVLDLASTNFQM